VMPPHIPTVANHLWQSTLFAAAAGLLTLALRKNRASVRYRLWLAASLKFLVPFALLVGAGQHMQWPAGSATTGTVRPISGIVEEIGEPFGPVAPTNEAPAERHGTATLLLPAIWLCGSALAAFSWFRRWRVVRTAVRAATPAWSAHPIPVMYSCARLEPGVVGVWRPVLLLPEGIAERLTAAQLAAVLAHEMCHVRRRDNLAMALHMVVETVFWFHPLAWWIRGRLIGEREQACDEEVMRGGCEPETYAEGILSVCRFCLEAPAACVSGVMGADLKKRIEAIATARLVNELNPGKRLLLGAAAVMAVAAPIAIGALHAPEMRVSNILPALLMAQGEGPPPVAPSAAPPPPPSWVATSPIGAPKTFEVASVKLSTLGVTGGVMRPGPGTLNLTNMTLEWLVSRAYGIRDFQVVGAPGWFRTQTYDIAAKAYGAPDLSHLLQLLQPLLADRFKLAAHHQQREIPVYVLTVGNRGIKMEAAVGPVLSGAPQLTGRLGATHAELTGQHVTMKQLVSSLTRSLGRPVIDKTGLAGAFDLKLEWTPDENELGRTMPFGASPLSPGESLGSSLFTAVKEQLGLKLESGKGPGDVLVIDHAERIPTDN
jgi:bla regulator protein blaR1